MTIRLLPLNIVNQISAGEAIERPASALKELMENAVDAGARNIDIDLACGGKALLRVADDGCGMTAEELGLAIQRHATSKLPDDNLFNISHLGFRGEALPSIGSVARLRLASRARGAENAWEINVVGGQVEPVRPTALAGGTTVEVRDLFFATPARLKFLRADASETAACEDAVERMALAYPEVRFTLREGGKPRLSFGDASERVFQVMGKQFQENHIVIDEVQHNVRLRGFIGKPAIARPNSLNQYLFVCGRAVRDRGLAGLLRAAYQNFMMVGRFPAVVLFIDLPGDEVDVNVHPAKAEVRFRHDKEIRALVVGAVRRALTSMPLDAGNVRQSGRGWQNYAVSAPSPRVLELQESYAAPLDCGDAAPPQKVPQDIDAQGIFLSSREPLGTPVGQALNTYVIAADEDGLVIVDQHAVHERLTFERLRGEPAASQALLTPVVVEVKPREKAALLAGAASLQGFGFVIESFGESSVAVRAANPALAGCDMEEIVRDLAADMLDSSIKTTLEDRLAARLARHACHTSIRAGRRLTLLDQHNLLRELEKNPVAARCIHGRPTYVRISRLELEKLFKRQ
ncbi:DNA mismatch repair protein MutL [Alphaproteobacteria bacterium]|nr:DNA mismatch repair protein MutL [Alphaproteobacteria bacterium]